MMVSWWLRSLAQTLVWYVGLAAWMRSRIAAFSLSMRWRCRFRPMELSDLESWKGPAAAPRLGVVMMDAIFRSRSVLSLRISSKRFSWSCFDLSFTFRCVMRIVPGSEPARRARREHNEGDGRRRPAAVSAGRRADMRAK